MPFSRSTILGIVLLGLGFLFTWTLGVNLYDETWFLQVVQRMREGEILYRDVFFGVNPISAYGALFFALFLGTEILALKLLQALCFVSFVFFALHISRILVPEKKWPWLLIGFLFVYCPPYPNSLYSPLGTVFFMATLYAILKWIQAIKQDHSEKSFRRFQSWLIWSGVFAGLTFGTKQNYGVLAILALGGVLLCASVPHARPQMRWAWIGMVSGSFLVVVLLTVVLPVLLIHSKEAYWEYVFERKIGYIQHNQISYFTEFRPLFNWMKPSFFSYVRTAYGLLFFLFPFVILPLLVYSFFWGQRTYRPEVLTLFFWGVASVLNAYPRFDFAHVVYSVPVMLVGAETVWIALRDRLNPLVQRIILWVLVLWLCPGIIQFIGRPIKRGLTGYYSVSNFPHFRYALFSFEEYNYLKNRIEVLKKDFLNPRRVFLLR